MTCKLNPFFKTEEDTWEMEVWSTVQPLVSKATSAQENESLASRSTWKSQVFCATLTLWKGTSQNWSFCYFYCKPKPSTPLQFLHDWNNTESIWSEFLGVFHHQTQKRDPMEEYYKDIWPCFLFLNISQKPLKIIVAQDLRFSTASHTRVFSGFLSLLILRLNL